MKWYGYIFHPDKKLSRLFDIPLSQKLSGLNYKRNDKYIEKFRKPGREDTNTNTGKQKIAINVSIISTDNLLPDSVLIPWADSVIKELWIHRNWILTFGVWNYRISEWAEFQAWQFFHFQDLGQSQYKLRLFSKKLSGFQKFFYLGFLWIPSKLGKQNLECALLGGIRNCKKTVS